MIYKNIIAKIAIVTAVFSSASTMAMTPSEAENALAQQCFSIQSPQSRKFIRQNGNGFDFQAADSSQADQFYFKPTRFKHFMLTNQSGSYLSSTSSAPTAGTQPGEYAEWKLQAISWGNYFRYRLHNTGKGQMVGHNYANSSLYYANGNPVNTNEFEFWLIPRNDCTPYPEIEVNVAGNPDVLKGDVNQPIRGFVDAHGHIASYEFMGGGFVHGDPFHRFGVTEALSDSSGAHGANGSLDLLGNIFAHDDIGFRYDTAGWPDFPYWPNNRDVSHTGYYYKWLERSWLGGMRMIVSHMVENKVLCTVQSTVHSIINPGGPGSPNSCEAMDGVRLQVQRLYEMQDYIDAQFGGPGKGFFRIVLSPAEARQVIADGKLAVFMGIEVSELFDCGNQALCSRAKIDQQLDEVYDLGIRGLFPVHRFDTKIGGAELEGGFLNAGQWLSAGYLFDVKECDADTQGVSIAPGFPLVGSIPVIGGIFNGISNAPAYDPNQRSCNKQGLSELGVHLINRMIDKGMLIELDHTSEKTADAILDIVEARNYSGVISAHSHLSRAPGGSPHGHFSRLVQAGGFVAPFNKSADNLSVDINTYLDEIETTSFTQGVSFGTDMTGLANQPGPRADAQADPLEYPFTTEFGLVFNKQTSGNRVMDFNEEGMAHIGMLADHVQDIREQATPRVYNAVMDSAEAYLQMWERAEANSDVTFANPLDHEVLIVTQLNGDCLGISGSDEQVIEGAVVTHAPCKTRPRQADQRWIYNKADGSLQNSANKSLCMASDEAFAGGTPKLRLCEGNDNTRWILDGYTLRSPNNPNTSFVLDAKERSGRTLLYYSHGRGNQQWELRSQREVNVWTTFRPSDRDNCLLPVGGTVADGTLLRVDICTGAPDQEWFYDVQTGTIKNRLSPTQCLDIPFGNTANGTRLQMWNCNGTINQQWDLDVGLIRARTNPNKVIDATNSGNITIYNMHGGNNQRWMANLQ